MVSGHSNGELCFWDHQEMRISLHAHSNFVRALLVYGDMVISASDDRTVAMHHIATFQLVLAFNVSNWAMELAVHQHILYVGVCNVGIVAYDLVGRKLDGLVLEHADYINGLFLITGTYLSIK